MRVAVFLYQRAVNDKRSVMISFNPGESIPLTCFADDR
jgi:hypothetical protein